MTRETGWVTAGAAAVQADQLGDWAAFVNSAAGAYLHLRVALLRHRDLLRTLPLDPSNPDPRVFMGNGDPNDPNTRQLHAWRLEELLAHVSDGGSIMSFLGNAWLVYVYQAWEDEYRPRIAQRLGTETRDIQAPIMGDVRLLRHDIIHELGVATQRHSGRCQLLRWGPVGQPILIGPEQVEQFCDHLGLTASMVDGPINP